MNDQPQWTDTETLLKVLAGRFPAMAFVAEVDRADGTTQRIVRTAGPQSRVIGMLSMALEGVSDE